MARDIASYQSIGKRVATLSGDEAMHDVSLELTALLQAPPGRKLVNNALLHMWGYVSRYAVSPNKTIESLSHKKLLQKIQQLALLNNVQYLMKSTALSELGAWTQQQLSCA